MLKKRGDSFLISYKEQMKCHKLKKFFTKEEKEEEE